MYRLVMALPVLGMLAPVPDAEGAPSVEINSYVMVQPIVVRGDDGRDPAKFGRVEPLIDQAYAAAGVDLRFFEPIFFDNTVARDGKIDGDTMVADARRAGILRGDGAIINLFVVREINRRRVATRRSQPPEWVAFVALADDESVARGAAGVARELGHVLGLDRTGEALTRVPVLTTAQVRIIRRSPLIQSRVKCLDVESGRRVILDESIEPYFSALHPREMAAVTGGVVKGNSLAARRAETRRRFGEAVLSFTPAEEETLTWFVSRIREQLGTDYPLLTDQPWRFLKVEGWVCGGLPHTRGTCILLNAPALKWLVAIRKRAVGPEVGSVLGLLVHEQMHVLQRFYPRRFAGLYRDVMGLIQGDIAPHPWLTERHVHNPDAPRLEWVFPLENDAGEVQHLGVWTLLRGEHPVPVMGQDFLSVAVPLSEENGRFLVRVDEQDVPMHQPSQAYADARRKLPTRHGLDHPNELAAYAFEELVRERLTAVENRHQARGAKSSTGAVMDQFGAWCRTHLK